MDNIEYRIAESVPALQDMNIDLDIKANSGSEMATIIASGAMQIAGQLADKQQDVERLRLERAVNETNLEFNAKWLTDENALKDSNYRTELLKAKDILLQRQKQSIESSGLEATNQTRLITSHQQQTTKDTFDLTVKLTEVENKVEVEKRTLDLEITTLAAKTTTGDIKKDKMNLDLAFKAIDNVPGLSDQAKLVQKSNLTLQIEESGINNGMAEILTTDFAKTTKLIPGSPEYVQYNGAKRLQKLQEYGSFNKEVYEKTVYDKLVENGIGSELASTMSNAFATRQEKTVKVKVDTLSNEVQTATYAANIKAARDTITGLNTQKIGLVEGTMVDVAGTTRLADEEYLSVSIVKGKRTAEDAVAKTYTSQFKTLVSNKFSEYGLDYSSDKKKEIDSQVDSFKSTNAYINSDDKDLLEVGFRNGLEDEFELLEATILSNIKETPTTASLYNNKMAIGDISGATVEKMKTDGVYMTGYIPTTRDNLDTLRDSSHIGRTGLATNDLKEGFKSGKIYNLHGKEVVAIDKKEIEGLFQETGSKQVATAEYIGKHTAGMDTVEVEMFVRSSVANGLITYDDYYFAMDGNDSNPSVTTYITSKEGASTIPIKVGDISMLGSDTELKPIKDLLSVLVTETDRQAILKQVGYQMLSDGMTTQEELNKNGVIFYINDSPAVLDLTKTIVAGKMALDKSRYKTESTTYDNWLKEQELRDQVAKKKKERKLKKVVKPQPLHTDPLFDRKKGDILPSVSDKRKMKPTGIDEGLMRRY